MPRIAAVAVLIVLALGVTACGSSSSSTSAAPAATSSSAPASSSSAPASSSSAPASSSGAAGSASAPAVQADPSGQLKFTASSLTATAGTVHITFTNHAPVGHNLTLVKGSGSTVVAATPTFTGGSRTLTAKLTPGTYTYFCSVPGHRAGGMQGTLTVK